MAALKNMKITYNPTTLINPVLFLCGILSGFSHSLSMASVLFYNPFSANTNFCVCVSTFLNILIAN